MSISRSRLIPAFGLPVAATTRITSIWGGCVLIMLLVAGLMYICATVIRVSMARSVGRNGGKKAEKLSFGGLKANLGAMFGLLFGGGLEASL